MYHLRKLKTLLLLLFVAVTAKAQLEDGKVYNFVNIGSNENNTKSLVALSLSDLSIATTDETAAQQLWYVEMVSDGVFALRNLYSGYYLHSPNTQGNTKWTLVNRMDESSRFTCTTAGGGYALRAANTTDNGLYMHYGAGTDRIVCWDANSGTTASHWKINEVEKTATIQELINNFPDVEAYQEHLNTLFADKACTSLNDTYKSMSVETLKTQEAYVGLPEALQQMVLKVRNGDNSWGEENLGGKPAWDAEYAKKYRVQLYEPYNEPGCAASALGLNAHTNLNNPTGIFANEGELLYIMVEGEIKEGASLYLASYTGNGNLQGYNDGVELSQGLNIVPSLGDGNNYCINYVVHTFDTSKGKGNKAKARKLSDFPDLKIHIEGGYINGYYNKMGDELYLGTDGKQGDKAADWDYVEARATQTTVTILGEYITLQFPLYDATDSNGATQKGMSYYLDQVLVEDVIDEWDKVMLWERLVLGVLDEKTTKAEAKKSPYSDKDYVFEYTGTDNDGFESGYGDYYNVHGLSLGIPNSYMYGGWNHCGYNYGTMQGIMVNMLTDAGSHWGPGHEIGHQHQNLLTVNGLTEVTNNLFANVVLWYFGETTSRVNGDNGSLSNVLAAFNTEGSDFFTNNIWALTHMYYKLFLYYHVLGHNTKFYPTLFEMLRQAPMSTGYTQNGATSLLHFYKKCCLASGDDLTEFFRAHGFFSVMDNRLVGDYANSVYTTTQADIDAAIKEVKALNYEENISVLFINDATGETIKSHKGDDLTLYGETTVCAELGSYASYSNSATPDYNYTISGNTVTMEGEGGTGFAIFNEKGEIIAFSNKKTFQISDDCVKAIASGKAIVKTVNADNTAVEAVNILDTDDTNAKYLMLGELLESAKAILDIRDETGKKVGFYRTASLTKLNEAYTTAKTVYDAKTVASYVAVYNTLFQEYANVMNDDYARIGIVESNAYRLTNKAYSGRSMAVATTGDDQNEMFGLSTDEDADAQKWYFEASNSLNRYYLKNKATSLYPAGASTGAVLSANKEASSKGADGGAAAYELHDMGGGVWALINGPAMHCSSSQSYNIVGWGADADASQWYITAVEVDDKTEALYELQNLVDKTKALIDEMANVQGKGTIELSAENITSNATESGHEPMYLFDGDVSTYFHTVWKESAVSEPHYLQVDLGESKSLAEFVWTYTTYNTTWGADFPSTVKVTGSTDNQLWHDIATLIDLPTNKGIAYESEILGSSNQSYRYLRFTVTATTSKGEFNDQYYFGLGEMGLTRVTTVVESIGDKYANFITAEEIKTVCDQIYAAQQACASGTVTSEDLEALQEQYDNLIDAYNRANNAALDAKKQELLALIANTTTLINSCGTVTYIPAGLNGALSLQTTSSTSAFYLSTNAQESEERSIKYLVDSDNATFFHSAWSWDVAATHYLQVDLGEGKSLNDFTFTYKTAASGPFPYTIKVYGSNEDNYDSFQMNLLATFSKDDAENALPTSASKEWNSSEISSATACRYLRFEVTNSGASGLNANPKGEYCFVMSYFGLTAIGTPESYTAELGANAGGATKELLLATYMKNAEAQGTYDYATTESQVEAAIAKLTAAKEALEKAKGTAQEYTVAVVGGNSQGGVVYGGRNYTNTTIFNAPLSLEVGDLTAIALDGYVANGVALNGTTITVTYNKVYSVQVVGVEPANGGVKLGEATYAGGATFDMLESSFDINNFTAIPLEGYAAYKTFEGSTITVTYKKVYTVQVTGGDADGGVIYNKTPYGNEDSFDAPQGFKVSDVMAIHVDGYVYTVTLEGNIVRVTYTKLIQDLSELRNYKAYHIRARSLEGYFAWNSSFTDEYVSLRGVTNWSYQQLPSNETVANKYTEAVSLSDKTVVWQIIKEDDSYYLYQPEKGAYVTRVDRDYKFTDTKTALDGIRQNSGDYAGTFGIHAGGGYSDTSQDYACICTGETPFAVRDWTWDDHGAVLQIIENPYVYALDYEVKVVGNANGGVEFEGESYTHGMTLSATELLTASDLTVKSIDGYESAMEISRENATITVSYTAIDKTDLINLITETQTLVNSASGYLGSSLNVTEALVTETREVLATAIEVRDNSSANREEYEAALTALQAAKSKLATAIAYVNLPVQLTFDVNSPVTYKITIGRGGNSVLAYDNTSSMVAVTDFELGNKAHGWYFMAATDGKVYIMPYYNQNTTLALSTNSFNEGIEKVKGMAIGSDGYTQEWTITNANMSEANRNAGWYNITTLNPNNVNTTWYFSNHSGVDNKMGFYNNANDDGSRFKFETISFDKPEAYYRLYNYYTSSVKLATGSIVGSDAVGHVSSVLADAYNTAYNNASTVINSDTSTDEDYTKAYGDLVKANEALVVNMPKEDKFYVLQCAHNGYAKNALAYANILNNKMYWATDKTTTDATAIWTFTPVTEGKFKVTNLHTGTDINGFVSRNPSPLAEGGTEVSFKILSVDGQVGILCGDEMMHAQSDYKAIVKWNGVANSASAWRIVEVTEDELSSVQFALTIGQYRHAGLYLNYAAQIPEGVKVYIAHTPDRQEGTILADELEGTILPARTAVIVKGNEDTYYFKYKESNAQSPRENLLGGSAYLKYQQVEETGNLCCVFGQKSGEVGLYKNWVGYIDANGTAAEDENGDGKVNQDNGTHFKISANKIYYEYKPSDVAGASAFRFRFNSKEEETTTIDELLMHDDTIIYNLYGQRIAKVVEPGIYIVNGKKMFVTEKMIGNNK